VTELVGVILAAGLATRMGSAKQSLPYGESTVLGSVIAAALASRLERVILVLGAHGNETLAAIDTAGIEVVNNPQPERGNPSSLLVATDRAGASPVLLLMGDMPGVDPAVIDAHLDAWSEHPAWMRVTEYSDGIGHPFTLSTELIDDMSSLESPKPLWAAAQSDRTEVLVIEAPMPVDIDTPEDYEDAVARDRPAP